MSPCRFHEWMLPGSSKEIGQQLAKEKDQVIKLSAKYLREVDTRTTLTVRAAASKACLPAHAAAHAPRNEILPLIGAGGGGCAAHPVPAAGERAGGRGQRGPRGPGPSVPHLYREPGNL